MTKKNRKFKRETFGNMEVIHNIGAELGEAGERMLADIMNAAEYAVNTVKEKYPEAVKTVKATSSEVADKATRRYANFKEEAEDAIKNLVNTLQEKAEADPENTLLNNFAEFVNELYDLGEKETCTCECGKKECKCQKHADDATPCTCKKNKCKLDDSGDDRCTGETSCFAEALKARSREEVEQQRFVRLMVERAWGFAKGENPVNTDWLYDDLDNKIGLVLTVYPNELHSTVKQNLEDVFGVRVIMDEIAQLLSLASGNIKYTKIDDNQSVIKIRY